MAMDVLVHETKTTNTHMHVFALSDLHSNASTLYMWEISITVLQLYATVYIVFRVVGHVQFHFINMVLTRG